MTLLILSMFVRAVLICFDSVRTSLSLQDENNNMPQILNYSSSLLCLANPRFLELYPSGYFVAWIGRMPTKFKILFGTQAIIMSIAFKIRLREMEKAQLRVKNEEGSISKKPVNATEVISISPTLQEVKSR